MIVHSLLLCFLVVNSCCESIGVFDDSVLFDISWPGLLPENRALKVDAKEEVNVNCVMQQNIIGNTIFYSKRLKVIMQTSQMVIQGQWLSPL